MYLQSMDSSVCDFLAVCASQGTGEWLPTLFYRRLLFACNVFQLCIHELWMRIYTCLLSVLLPALINTVLNVLIFAHVQSSARRVQPDANTQVDQSGCRNLKNPGRFRWFLCRIRPVFVGSNSYRPFPCNRIPIGFFRGIPVSFRSVSSRNFLEPIGADRSRRLCSKKSDRNPFARNRAGDG